jgi:APA family basic amino acid/polyamine antiporter
MSREPEPLYTRRATGLVRQIGIVTAVVIALSNVIGLGWQKRVFQATGWTPVGESQYPLGIHPIVMAFLITGSVMLVSLYVFSMLAAAMPKSGGGYVFISRVLSPGLGFVATWLQFFAVAVTYGLVAVATFEAVAIFGGLAGISLPPWLDYGWGYFIGGVVVIAIFGTLASLGIRLTGYLLHSLFWVPAVMLAVIYIIFLTATPETMEQGTEVLFGHSAIEYTQAAIDQGMARAAAGNTYGKAVASAILAAYWAYIGYAAASFVAGEVREAPSTLPRAMFISGLLIMFIYMTISSLMVRAARTAGQVGDFSLMSAIGYMNSGGGDFAAAGLPPIGGWMPMIAAVQAAGLGMRWVMPLLVLFAALWVANDIPPFILTTSRMIFAMAFDRLLPSKLAEVNRRWRSPVNAIIFVSAVSIILGCSAEADLFAEGHFYLGRFIYSIVNPAGAIAATDIWDILFFLAVAVAGMLFPIRKPGLFERSPFRLEREWSIAMGALAVVGNLVMLYVVATHPQAWNLFGINDLESAMPFLFSIFLILAGAGVYAYCRNRARRAGVDLNAVFGELPPD